jgi:hypothetical protein
MALADREREKIQSPQNSLKLESSQISRHNISNGINGSSNRLADQKIFAVKVLVNLSQLAGMIHLIYF